MMSPNLKFLPLYFNIRLRSCFTKNVFEVFIALKVQVLLFCSFLSLTNAESSNISSTKKALFHITHKVAGSNKYKSIFILPFLSFSCSERCSYLSL
jgi:hypothetical protein